MLFFSSQQDKPCRAASWHSSQTGSQLDSMSECQEELEVPATQKEAETPGPTEPLPPTPEKTTSNPEPRQPAIAQPIAPAPPTQDKVTSSNPEPAAGPAPRPTPDKGTSSDARPKKPTTAHAVAPAPTPTPDKATSSDPRPKQPTTAPPIGQSDSSAPEPRKPDPSTQAKGKQSSKTEPDDEEYRAPVEDFPPPAAVGRATLMKRLARICAPKEDGTYKVPMEIIQTHKNLETRDDVYRAFEKCGCDPVSPPRLQTV